MDPHLSTGLLTLVLTLLFFFAGAVWYVFAFPGDWSPIRMRLIAAGLFGSGALSAALCARQIPWAVKESGRAPLGYRYVVGGAYDVRTGGTVLVTVIAMTILELILVYHASRLLRRSFTIGISRTPPSLTALLLTYLALKCITVGFLWRAGAAVAPFPLFPGAWVAVALSGLLYVGLLSAYTSLTRGLKAL